MAFGLFMKTCVIIRMVFHLFLLFIHNKSFVVRCCGIFVRFLDDIALCTSITVIVYVNIIMLCKYCNVGIC